MAVRECIRDKIIFSQTLEEAGFVRQTAALKYQGYFIPLARKHYCVNRCLDSLEFDFVISPPFESRALYFVDFDVNEMKFTSDSLRIRETVDALKRAAKYDKYDRLVFVKIGGWPPRETAEEIRIKMVLLRMLLMEVTTEHGLVTGDLPPGIDHCFEKARPVYLFYTPNETTRLPRILSRNCEGWKDFALFTEDIQDFIISMRRRKTIGVLAPGDTSHVRVGAAADASDQDDDGE